MNTGIPAVNNGNGWALARFEITAGDLKASPPMPLNWPRDRVPSPEEWDRIEEARRIREARYLKQEMSHV